MSLPNPKSQREFNSNMYSNQHENVQLQSTVLSHQQHPFGKEEIVSGQQLFLSFCNNLYLGQWELARACGQRLAQLSLVQEDQELEEGSHLNNNITQVLKAVVRHPYHSVGSESIPSPHILTWLSLQLHNSLQNDKKKDEPLSEAEKKQVEFSLLLYTATIDRDVPENTIQEIYNKFTQVHRSQYTSSSPSSLSIRTSELPGLSQQIQTFLKCLLKENPILGHAILEHLKDRKSSKALKSPYNQGFQQLYIDCIYDALADLHSSETTTADAIKQIYKMLSLLDPPSEMTKLPLETLFTNLIGVIQDKPNTLVIHSIYSTLMGRSTTFLISEFCKCQEKLHRQKLNSLVGTHSSKLDVMSQDVRITLRLSEMKDREQAWKEMFFQAINGGRHALENIVDTSLTFIREGMFEELKTLMSPDEFHPLKPLVLLLGWNYVNSCAKANKLLESLFAMDEQSSKDPLLEQACNKLAYQVHLVQWCLEKARPLMLASGLDPSIDPKAGELFHGLDCHSVLRVLHQSTHLSQLEPTEVFDMLSKRPQLELKQTDGLGKDGEKEKCVRFASNIEEPLHLSIQQERDNTIYRSFLTIKLFMDALEFSVCQDNGWPYPPTTQAKETTQSGESTPMNSRGETDQQTTSDIAWGIHVTQKINSARDYLTELFPLTYRVEILEDIFSLLFVRHEHFHSEGTGAQSDSGGEEGLVDEDWQNKSCTSLESVDIHDPIMSNNFGMEHMSQQQSTKEVTFHQATLDNTSLASKDGKAKAQGGKSETLEKTSAEKTSLPASGILKQRLSGLPANGSSEASQYSNSSLSLQGKVGFVANERFTHDVISILKECMLDLTSAKFALQGTSMSKSNVQQPPQGNVDQATREMTKYMKCAVKKSALAQRISKLSQHINEAWWRFQLVCQSKQSASATSLSETNMVHESSSDDEWRRVGRDSDGEDGEGSETRKRRKKKRQGNRSRSASGKLSSDPMYSALSSPSSEIPSTEGTSSGTEKKRKRRRTRSRRDEKVYWSDNSIIARMLSSKDTLLRMCVRRGSYTQAKQVIKMFDMEGKPEVSEVFFAEFWEKAVQKIQAADERKKKKSVPSSPGKQTTLKLSPIGSIASAGVASTSVTSVIDDLLTTSALPVLPQAVKVIENDPKVHGHVDVLQHLDDKRVPAMVVFDLSITSCKAWQSCRDLLDVAKGRLDVQSSPPEAISRQRSVTAATGSGSKSEQFQALLGVIPFIHQMHNLINVSTSECNIRQDVLKENYQYSVRDALLNACNPLDVTNLGMQINNHLDLKKATSSLSRALKTLQSGFLLPVEPTSRVSSSELSISSSGNERLSKAFHDSSPASSPTKPRQTSLVHQSTKHLLQLFDKIAPVWYTVYALPQERGKRKDNEMANYMLSLYNHVNVLASLLLEAKDWHPGLNRPVHSGNLKAPNPFSILDESPSLLLGRLMFQNQIPPIRLEGVANQLKLNLIHIIVQSCCPCILIQPVVPSQQTLPELPPPTSHSQFKPASTSPSLQKVLNDSGDWTEPVRHPELVARELLSRLITLMKSQVENYTTSKTCDLTGIVLAVSSQEYLDIVSATRELAAVDLNLLTKPEEKLCCFTNIVNLLLVHGAMDHIYTGLMNREEAMTPSHTRHHSLQPRFDFDSFNLTYPPSCSDLVLERLGYLSKICYRVGQLGVISAFDLQYIFLRSELPPPSTFGQILQHRVHDIGEDDPWYQYLPPIETRLLFVISNGCISSPVLQVLKVDDLEEQLTIAMQQYLENNVLVDKEKNVVSIPEYLDWFRKDFTGKSLPIDIQDGHIYGGLLNVVIPHVSQHLGEQLESLVLSCSPGKIELERSMEEAKGDRIGTSTQSVRRLKKAHSFRFTIRIRRYRYNFAYKFQYQSSADGSSGVHELHRSSSNPELASADNGRLRSNSFPMPPFKMTESTLRYLHSKSKLVASLVGVISVAVDDRTDRFASQKSMDSVSKDDDVARSGQSVPGIEESVEEELRLSEGGTKHSETQKLRRHVSGYATVQRYMEAYMTTVLKVTEALQAEPDQSCPELASSNTTGLTWRNTRACVLSDLRSKEVQWLFHLTLNHLMSSCKWSECLEFIDALQKPNEDTSEWLQDVPLIRDFVLCCAAQGMPSQQDENMSVDSWRYLLRVEDQTLAARVVLGSVSSLSVAASLELLHHCHAYPSKDIRLCSAIKDKLEKMKLYQKITEYAFQHPPSPSFELVQESDEFPMQPAPNPYLEWQYVADESQSNPHRILDILMLARDFDLAKHWAEVHGVYDTVRQDIQEKYLAHLLKQEQNSLKCFQVLEAIKLKHVCLSICESLLSSSDISLSSSVFLVQYVLDHFLDDISPEKVEDLQSISMGAKALLCLPERARSDYQQLISKPSLIVEQLLMNIKVDWAAQVLQCLSHELANTPFTPSSCSVQVFDKLVCKYAADAMYIPKINLNLSGDLEASLMHSSTVSSLSSLSMMSTSTTPKPGLRHRISITAMTSTRGLQSSAPTPLSTTPVNVPSPIPGSRSITPSFQIGDSPGALSTTSSFPRGSRPLRRQSSVGELRITSPPPVTRKTSVSKLPEIKLPSTPPRREDWVPDASVTHCMVCKEERFSMFNRRHHCRRCGRVVCWRCSQLKAVIEGYGDTPVRVCSECFNTFIMPRSSQSKGSYPGMEQRIRERLSGSRLSASRSPGGSLRGSPNRGSPVMGSMPGTPHSNFSDGTQQNISLEFQLTADEDYNTIVRQDFYYEQAPSASLCLSILELHSDPRECGQQILQRCQDLSELLRPIKPGVTNPEVDYNLVISMMKTLLFNAKLKFLKDGDSSSVELCDTYLSHVDLLGVFVSSNCADIPSIQQLQKADSARRVRDRLVKEERLLLAQEVATKSGLDPAAVWTAWGMSCLRAGDYQSAREKFSRILKAPSDGNQMQPPPKLVADIMQYLESASAATVSLTEILTASAGSIRDFIAEPKAQSSASLSAIFDSPALQECLYYIKTYCSYITMVHFYRKHKNINLAVNFILQKRCSTEVFIEGLLVPCMKQGDLSKVQEQMLQLDPTLSAWNAYLTAVCRYLNRNGLSHVLYHFQLFMKDFVRAAMTCIKFFQSGVKTYSDLFDRLHHLEKARLHFKAVLDEKQWGSVPRPPMTGGSSRGSSSGWGGASADSNIRLMLTPSELTKHMNTMKIQIEVTKFLHRMAGRGSGLEGQGTASSVSQKPPTLFGNSKEKAEVARKVLLSGNTIQESFQLAFRIIQDFRLPDTLIYSHVGRHLATIRKYKEIRQLLSCIRDTGLANDQNCDEILDACVRILADEQTKEAEALIKLMKSDTNKINAYILCGKLKSAYLLAVKGERVEDVQRIMRAAKQAGQAQAQMKAICQTWLAGQEEKRLREQQAQQLLFQSRQPKH